MYERLRAQHPAEFEPASVFFTHDERSFIDRRKSLRVKAALVYEAVTGRHEDDDQMQSAKILLLALAKKCHSKMHPETAVVHGGGTGMYVAGPTIYVDRHAMRVQYLLLIDLP